MNSDTSLSAEALLAERARLENLLDVSEDWRALTQLRSRSARGEGLSAIDAANLEAMLVQSLADNPFYGPYRSVCLAIEKISGGPGANGASSAKAPGAAAQSDGRDNFTRIRGVNAALAKRLSDFGIVTFAEIAEWRAADIQRVSSGLQLGKQIYAQNWIEQATLLAATSPNKLPPKSKPEPAAPLPASSKAAVPTVQTAAKRTETFNVAPQSVASAPQPAGSAGPSAPAVELPEDDPNQLLLDFTRKPERPRVETKPQPAPAASAPVAPVPVAPVPVAQPPIPSLAPQSTSAQSSPAKPVEPARPVGPPPRPMVPWRYGQARPAAAPTAKPALAKVPDPVVPPPAAPASAANASAPSKPVMPPAIATHAVLRPLPQPPRPLVVTRASLPRVEPIQNTPAKSAPPLLPVTGPSANSAPAMSITEALAYAAEIAKKGQKPELKAELKPDQKSSDMAAADVPAQPARVPPGNEKLGNDKPGQISGAKSAAQGATTSAVPPPPLPGVAPKPSAPITVTPAAPPTLMTPPPLPQSFKAPPPPPPPRPQPAPRIEQARYIEREDFANRSNVEEASVEIVRKRQMSHSAPIDPAMAAALAASNVQAKARSEVPEPEAEKPGGARGGTPIGRFLKALTGN